MSPLLLFMYTYYIMIDKQTITDIVSRVIADTDAFITDITVTPANDITVELDAMTGIDLDFCALVTRAIEQELDRDVEDYSLEVGSASLSAPLKVAQQDEKHIGDTMDVLTRDGRKLRGTIVKVSPETMSFILSVPTKVKEPGAKRPVIVDTPVDLLMADCRSVT